MERKVWVKLSKTGSLKTDLVEKKLASFKTSWNLAVVEHLWGHLKGWTADLGSGHARRRAAATDPCS